MAKDNKQYRYGISYKTVAGDQFVMDVEKAEYNRLRGVLKQKPDKIVFSPIQQDETQVLEDPVVLNMENLIRVATVRQVLETDSGIIVPANAVL